MDLKWSREGIFEKSRLMEGGNRLSIECRKEGRSERVESSVLAIKTVRIQRSGLGSLE